MSNDSHERGIMYGNTAMLASQHPWYLRVHPSVVLIAICAVAAVLASVAAVYDWIARKRLPQEVRDLDPHRMSPAGRRLTKALSWTRWHKMMSLKQLVKKEIHGEDIRTVNRSQSERSTVVPTSLHGIPLEVLDALVYDPDSGVEGCFMDERLTGYYFR